MKRKLFFVGLFLSLSAFLFAQKTETRNVSGFSAIDAGSVFNITVNKSATESLRIEADDDIMPYVRSEVKNGVLRLYVDKNNAKNIKTLKATIGVKDLKKVKLSGASKLTSDDLFNTPEFDIKLSGACAVKLNIKCNELDVDASGASNLDLEAETQEAEFDLSGASTLKLQLKAKKAEFGMSGAGKADIKGTADKAEFKLSGASTIKAGNFACEIVSVKSSGSGKLSVNASEQLVVNSSGASTVSYKGRPVVKINTSGSAKVYAE
ncbi:MAG: DUF2807 domain-containing protein [Bacteroidales bacterium]|nr:DUF2807 domain-containing protein [Bacteroidales bacterium]